jgi:hypothetical protein
MRSVVCITCSREETNVLGNRSGKRSRKREKQAETQHPKEFLQPYEESPSPAKECNGKASCHIDNHHWKANEQAAKAARETPRGTASLDRACSLALARS